MKCSFCGKSIEPGTGKIFVKKTGKKHFFCSSKCENNLLKLGRTPSKFKWTKAAQKERTAEAKEGGK